MDAWAAVLLAYCQCSYEHGCASISLKFHFQLFGIIYPDVELLAYIDYIVVVFNFQQPLHRVTHQQHKLVLAFSPTSPQTVFL